MTPLVVLSTKLRVSSATRNAAWLKPRLSDTATGSTAIIAVDEEDGADAVGFGDGVVVVVGVSWRFRVGTVWQASFGILVPLTTVELSVSFGGFEVLVMERARATGAAGATGETGAASAIVLYESWNGMRRRSALDMIGIVVHVD